MYYILVARHVEFIEVDRYVNENINRILICRGILILRHLSSGIMCGELIFSAQITL